MWFRLISSNDDNAVMMMMSLSTIGSILQKIIRIRERDGISDNKTEGLFHFYIFLALVCRVAWPFQLLNRRTRCSLCFSCKGHNKASLLSSYFSSYFSSLLYTFFLFSFLFLLIGSVCTMILALSLSLSTLCLPS